MAFDKPEVYEPVKCRQQHLPAFLLPLYARLSQKNITLRGKSK